MAIRVLLDAETEDEAWAEMDAIIGWVNSFERIPSVGSFDPKALGEISFLASSVEQYRRVVDYVASWDGEPAVA
jgi:hypothetical protein